MATVYYVAYGSNLHPLRLQERVPSAQALGAFPLPDYTLAFHKHSRDSSGKCLLRLTEGDTAYGVLYEFDVTEKRALDEAEGKGHGYLEQQMPVSLNGIDYLAYIYMASSTHINNTLAPYHWYKALVIAGATYHGLPQDYVDRITAIPSIPDFDDKRRGENENLLSRMGWI